MIRDILVACVLLAIAAFGLSFTEFGRSVIGAFSNDDEISPQDMAATLRNGGAWCFWPEESGRCAWVITADAPRGETFDVAVFAAERGPSGALRISVARSGLMARNRRLCQNPLRPVTPSRLGYYSDEIGEVTPAAVLRLATEQEHASYLGGLADTGDAEVCFRFVERGEGRWAQYPVIAGEVADQAEEFVVMTGADVVLLAAP